MMTNASGEATDAQGAAPHPRERLRFDTLAREICNFLAITQRRVDTEIRSYPTPIPRCDAQFNHLYDQRSRIARRLHAVEDALAAPVTDTALAGALGAWRDEPPCTDGDAERDLRARLVALLPAAACRSDR